MPALPNRRQEIFCQKLAKGIPPYRAYPEAGYKPHAGNPYRMSENERIQQRLIELTGTADIRFLSDRDTLMQELATVGFAPVGGPDVKVSEKTKALMDIAKIAGHLIDRKEVRVVDEFESMTDDELIAYIDASYSEIKAIGSGEETIEDQEDPAEEGDGD